jgi:ABC-2 type transport system permease protein
MFWPSIFLKAMREQRVMVLGFGLGSALMAALVLGIYPSYREGLSDIEIPPALKALFGDIDLTTANGFLSAEFFSWIPVLLVVYAIIQGTGVLAGEESNGTLDLLLAQPISRTRLFIEKAFSIIVGTLIIVALILPGWLIPYAAADIDVALGRLLVATAAMAPLVLAFAALSLLAGCLLPTRRDAATAIVAVAVVSYFVNSLGQAVEVLEPLRPASLFFYYRAEKVLVPGVDPAGVAVLLGTAVVAGGLALAAFQRRDLGVVLGGGLLERVLRALPAPGSLAAREGAGSDERD